MITKTEIGNQPVAVVVRLTSNGFSFISEGHNEEEYAAIRIQTAFRGYLVCANAIVVFNCILVW
jgi:hypothetical protein